MTDDDLKARIRAAGLRFSMPRLAVLRLLHAAAAPLAHGEVVEALRGAGFDQSTVYRNLIDLSRAGVILRRELGDHTWRFEASNGPDDGHAHFLCVECGDVRCLPDVRLDSAGREAAARVGAVTEVLIKGRCAGCDAADPALGRSGEG